MNGFNQIMIVKEHVVNVLRRKPVPPGNGNRDDQFFLNRITKDIVVINILVLLEDLLFIF